MILHSLATIAKNVNGVAIARILANVATPESCQGIWARQSRRRTALIFVLCSLLCQCGCNSSDPRALDQPSASASARETTDSVSRADESPVVDSDANQPRAGDWFADVTRESGIDFSCLNGRDAGRYYLIESFGGGVAMIDYDLDGDIDLFFTGGGAISVEDPARIAGRICPLFRNEGELRFVDVTTACALTGPEEYSQGCAVTDFDVDGFPDLFVCGVGHSRLYRNQGDGTYAAVADESLDAPGWGTAAAWGDFDRDGLPDLFLARYTTWSPQSDVACRNQSGIRDLCGPTSYSGTACLFLHNSGDGGFENWSDRAKVADDVRGLGVVAADLNGDGWLDFFVASDESQNRLYLGGPSQQFEESAELAGVALGEWGGAQGSMGVAVADYNGDGLPDVWITNFETEDDSLYRNLGKGVFVHASVAAGLSGLTRMRVGFGTALSDFDGDGWPDLFVLNGNTSYSTGRTPFKQSPQLFHNFRGRRFEEISEQSGTFFRGVHAGRGAAVGDLNDDGSLDIVTVHINDQVRILANQLAPANFTSVRLVARQGEPDATGSRVWADFEGRRLTHFVTRGTGFFSHSDSRTIFPMTAEQPALDVTVEWVGRLTERFRGLTRRRTNLLVEGRGEPIERAD